MFRICDGATAAEGYCCPTVVLVGTSFQFSDRLIKLLKVDFDDIYFERSMNSNIVLEHETQPRVIIVHESCDDLEGRISLFQRKLPKTQIAVACSDTTIIERLNATPRHNPISAINMDAQVDVWFSILRLLLSGYPYVPVESCPRPRTRQPGPEPFQASSVRDVSTPDMSASERLTPRELEILPMIARGAQNKTIADTLGLSIHTVKLHSHNIFTKLGVPSRTGAANWYLSNVGDRVLDHADTRSR